MEHIERAAYDTVHKSSIPSKEIAERLGINHQVLLNKVNEQCESNKLTLAEAVAIQRMTGDHRITIAMTDELTLSLKTTPTKAPLDAMLTSCIEQGEAVKRVHEALADGHLTPRESEECNREIDDSIKALEALRQSIVAHGRGIRVVEGVKHV